MCIQEAVLHIMYARSRRAYTCDPVFLLIPGQTDRHQTDGRSKGTTQIQTGLESVKMRPGWRPHHLLWLLSIAIACSSGIAYKRISNADLGIKPWRGDFSNARDQSLPMGGVLRLYGGMDEAAKAARAARMKQMQEKSDAQNESVKDASEMHAYAGPMSAACETRKSTVHLH